MQPQHEGQNAAASGMAQLGMAQLYEGLGFIWGFPKNRGTFLGVPIIRTITYSHNKDYNILGSILGHPNFGKVPFVECLRQVWRLESGLGLPNLRSSYKEPLYEQQDPFQRPRGRGVV